MISLLTNLRKWFFPHVIKSHIDGDITDQQWAGIISGGVGLTVGTAFSLWSARDAKVRARDIREGPGGINEQQIKQQNLLNSRQGVIDPYENLTNEYANMSVAVKAAEFQAEEADIALANTLDTLRATGAGAGGATALAQAALKSKRGVSASLESQQTANEKLRAEGEMKVQELKAKGREFKWSAQEKREMTELDRSQAQLDLLRMQEMQYNQSRTTALAGIGTSTMGVIGGIAGSLMSQQ